MAKRFSPEFKQQAIDYALSNSHESVAAIAQKLGVGYSTLDKWIREANPQVQVNVNSRQNNSVFSI
jgi:transposase-like protein